MRLRRSKDWTGVGSPSAMCGVWDSLGLGGSGLCSPAYRTRVDVIGQATVVYEINAPRATVKNSLRQDRFVVGDTDTRAIPL